MSRRLGVWAVGVVATWAALVPFACAAPRGADGELRIEIVEAATGQPLPARMHLKTSRSRPVKLRLPQAAAFGDHFYIDGQQVLPLRQGQFSFELEATPEYLTQSGHFEIQRHADDSKKIEMRRFADLAAEGWWGGDVDFDRSEKDLPLVLRAEGLKDIHTSLHAVLLTDELDQSAIPNPKAAIQIARTPYAWNLPVWLASGKLDAIELINNHSLRDDTLDHEKDGRPRDRSLYPSHNDNGRWSETVYYHVLNCGLRIPPVAGSGSGENDSPVGTNRVYVYCGDEYSEETWWDGIKGGRVFVTNGPLLRPMVGGQPPGHVFYLSGDSLELEIGLNLATRVPVEYLQIVKNGAVEAEVRLADWKKKKGRLPTINFDKSGWFLVRAITNNRKVYQFASSGPYYVDKADTRHISRQSVQFFLDWIDAAKDRVVQMQKLSGAKRKALLADQDAARKFFEELLASANAN
jgi:hypothetical protein